jgi:hypothetical protein
MKKSTLLIGRVGLQAPAQTTTDPVNLQADAANAGWLNRQGAVTNGVVIGQANCHGCIYWMPQ